MRTNSYDSGTRRTWLLAAVSAASCGRSPGTGYHGYAFVANEEGRSIAAVDLNTFSVTKQIPLDDGPTAVLADPWHSSAYVFTPRSGKVHELDLASLAWKRTAKTGGPALSMRMAPDGKSLWVLARESRTLTQILLEDMGTAARIKLPADPADFDLSREGQAAVSFPAEGKIALVNLTSRRVEHLLGVGVGPETVRFRQGDQKHILVANRGDRTVSILDVAAGRAVVHLPLAIEPRNFCFKNNGGELYVTGPGLDAVVVIFPYETQVYETRLAGRSPGAMAVSDTPEYLFVANTEAGNLTVLDVTTGKVVAVVAVGNEPTFIAITPDNRYALVVNRGSGDLAVIRIAALGNKRAKPAPTPLFTMIRVGSKPVSAAVRRT